MTITVAFIGQSVGNYMFTQSIAPPACPANCYMLNRATYQWGPVTGNGAIEYARRLNQITGQEIRLYNACWDSSAMVSNFAPPRTPNLYWTNMAGDGPLASFFGQVSAGGFVPNLLELVQGQAEFWGLSNPQTWIDGATTMYSAILSHFNKTGAQMPITVWSGFRGGPGTSRNVLWAHRGFTPTGAAPGPFIYDSYCPDYVHPDAVSSQINGARDAVIALKRLGVQAYSGADNGPVITSAARTAHILILKTSGHDLDVQPFKELKGFQVFPEDFSEEIEVTGARVTAVDTIRLTLGKLVSRPIAMYQADAAQNGGAAPYDTQDCFVPGIGMPLQPCLSVQSAT